MKKELIEVAYEIANKKYKKGKFKYRDLLAEVIKANSEYKDLGGDLYIDIISDVRFLSLGNDEWALQEYYKYEEFEKISSAMFGLDQEIDDIELDELEKSNDVIVDEYENIDKNFNIKNNDSIVEIDENIKNDDVINMIEDIEEIEDIELDELEKIVKEE